MWENRCSYSEVLLLFSISLSTTGCQISSPDREKQPAVIPLYLETGIQKTCPTKPSPAPLKHCISLLLLCASPLKHCAASGTLCVTPAGSAWMTQTPWPLRCLCWALCGLLWLRLLTLCLCAGLSALSLPAYPVLTTPRC